MSKIGRKPIPFSSAKVEVKGNNVLVSGAKLKFEHELPVQLVASIDGSTLVLTPTQNTREVRAQWGLHRALLANKIHGIEKGFELAMKIVGLGYKAQISGKDMVFSLGYSHKVEYTLPVGVTVDVDRTGQQLLFKSHDKGLLGSVCDKVRSFRTPEPYKGTGVMRADEEIIRKAGKTGA
ncbi:50S ribosomal protein L6 [Candidatus Dependentiae bacterium]|nr:50S ribosomal protein L6 [Candidatus Dependentiae bacterium]